MSDLVFAEKDGDVILGEVLALYKTNTGIDLKPADPRRLHMQQIILLLVQARALIDFAGKQNLLRYVSSLFIGALAELLGETANTAQPSRVTMRYVIASGTTVTVAAGKRVTNGAFIWAALADTTNTQLTDTYVDVLCECTTSGSASNGYAAGQIGTLVDSVVGSTGALNIDSSAGGTDAETTEAFRTRLRSVPIARAVAGPRLAYQELALAASAAVVGAVAVGEQDAADMDGSPPGTSEVFILIIEGTRDQAGTITSAIPDPSVGVLTTVRAALTADDVRPLADKVTVKAPSFVDFDVTATYYIAQSRSKFVSEIQADVTLAFEAYETWQVAIGRDINPTELSGRLWQAGAKRVVVTSPTLATIKKDQCSRIRYETLTYGGLEDD